MTTTPVYDRLVDAVGRTERFVSSCGGTRSGKTFAALQFIFKLALSDTRPTITSVVSETFPHLKRGAIRDFREVLGDLWDEDCWSKGESIYTLRNGSRIEFFSADAPAKVHGPARDRLFLNEVQNIPWEIARQLFVRTRGLVLMDYNPTHEGWVQEQIESRQECVTIHSTYKDNSFLSPEQVREIEANQGDANWWRVYGLGLVGSLEGLIYPDFQLIDKLPENEDLTEVWGMDFGFQDPTAIVKVLADPGRKVAYIQQKCYERAMKNEHITAKLVSDPPGRYVNIWADCEDPKSIKEIGDATGLKIRPCDKSAPVRSDKRKFQIQWMQGWRLFVTKDSLDLIKDLRNYCFEKDKDGNLTDYPIHEWSHGPDALRYALYTQFAGKNTGNYTIGFASRQRTYDTLHR